MCQELDDKNNIKNLIRAEVIEADSLFLNMDKSNNLLKSNSSNSQPVCCLCAVSLSARHSEGGSGHMDGGGGSSKL